MQEELKDMDEDFSYVEDVDDEDDFEYEYEEDWDDEPEK